MSNPTPNTLGDKTVSDAPIPVPSPAKPESPGSWIRAEYQLLPDWAKTIAILLILAIVIYGRMTKPDAQPPVVVNNLPATASTDSPGWQPVAADQTTTVRERPGRRLFAKLIRSRLASRLQKDGFALAGGNPKPLSEEQAWELVDRLDDDTVIAAAVQSKAEGLGDGTLLDKLGNVIQWIIDHKEQILAIVKVLMTLLALFADDSNLQSYAVPAGPPPPMPTSEVAYLDVAACGLAV